MQIDPICGMQVDENTAQYKTDYKGKTYYFCVPGVGVAGSATSISNSALHDQHLYFLVDLMREILVLSH